MFIEKNINNKHWKKNGIEMIECLLAAAISNTFASISQSEGSNILRPSLYVALQTKIIQTNLIHINFVC